MVQVVMSPELSAWVADRIARYGAEATEPYHVDEASSVAEFAALPLIRHWFETFGLRADGEVVRWSTDHPQPYRGTRPVDDRYDWLCALVEGARRWPELQVLLPPRPGGAVDCECVVHSRLGPVWFLCPICCGLGWVSQ
jgi:hypothetical protein